MTSWTLYLHGREIDESGIRRVIRKGTLEGRILPVLCGTAFKNKGIQPLLDAIVDYLPSPIDISPHLYWTEDGEEEPSKGLRGRAIQRALSSRS